MMMMMMGGTSFLNIPSELFRLHNNLPKGLRVLSMKIFFFFFFFFFLVFKYLFFKRNYMLNRFVNVNCSQLPSSPTHLPQMKVILALFG
jgi:hypothetical protein